VFSRRRVRIVTRTIDLLLDREIEEKIKKKHERTDKFNRTNNPRVASKKRKDPKVVNKNRNLKSRISQKRKSKIL